MTMLMHVAGAGSAEMVNEFLGRQPDINAKDNYGRNALHHAARAGNVEAFTVLA